MPVEIYFTPKPEARTIELTDLEGLFAIDGNRCRIEKENDLYRLIFDKFKSDIVFSVNGSAVVFATLHWVSSKDGIAVVEQITHVFESLD